ncbi:MAG: hypothetical protein ACI906_000584 [Candidatus Latescibacterota bacterium]|jgi:hypothetical protein
MRKTHILSAVVATILLSLVGQATAQKSNELYEIEFKDPKTDGYFEPLQDKYFWFKAKKGFHLFDAYTGEAKWSHKELPDFDGKYTLLWEEDYLLYSTKKGAARLDVESGEIAWSTEMEKLKFKDVSNWWETDHGLVVQIKNNLAMLDIDDGTEKWWVPIKPSSEIANKRGLPFFYDLGDRFLVLAKDGPVLLDAQTGETLMSIKGKYNKKSDPFVEVGNQVAFFFDKSISMVDLNAAKVSFTIEGKVEETTAFETIEANGKNYILFGFNKRLIAFDGDSGEKLWETPEGTVGGSVRWVQPSTDPGKVLILGLRVDKFGKDAGTWLKLYSIDIASGAIAWEQMVGYSQLATVGVGKTFANGPNPYGGLDISIWFEGPFADEDNLIFLIKGLATGDPVSLERDESQGFISINTRSGKVNYLTRLEVLHPKGKEGYAKLATGVLWDLNEAYPKPIDEGATVLAAGYQSIVRLDKKSGKLLWQVPTPGLPTSMVSEEGIVLAQLGKIITNTTLEKGGVKTKTTAAKPFGLMAIDVESGKKLWANTDFKYDPMEAMSAVFENGVLYGCDGEDLYAMSLQDGNFKWKFNINKDGKAGKITGDKAWAVNVEQSSESLLGTKTTTTTWSNPRRILRTDYRDTHFVVFGDKQIIRVNKEDGALAWSHKWKYDPNQRRLQFDPTYVGDNDDIVYACNGFYGIDGKTGEIKWEDKDVEGEYTQVADDLLVVRKKDKVWGYSLK